MLPTFDLEAAAREGLDPVRCPSCKSVLALQSRDGNTLHLNLNARSYGGSKGTVALNCTCGTSHTWRASRGSKRPDKNGNQRKDLTSRTG
jgi:hypothetical protein